MALSYTIREGLAGFSRAKLATATSVTALAIALVLIGMFSLLGWQWNRLADSLRDRAGEAEVFLKPADAEITARVGDRLREVAGIDSIRFVSHEEAAQIFREAFGEGADLYSDEQFLPASYKIRLSGAYASPDSLQKLAARVSAWAPVDEVAYDEDLLQAVERNRAVFSAVALAVALLVVLAALLLVGNTVRLSIYARRLLIRTMKLVGATNSFIRRPFLVEGLVHGLVAGVVAGGILYGLYELFLGTLRRADALGMDGGGWPGGSPFPAILGIVAVGILLGWLASWVAVRRFVSQVQLS